MKNFTKIMMATVLFGGVGMSASAVTVVEEFDLSVTKTITNDWASVPMEFDVTKVMELLGVTSMEEAEVVSLDADGEPITPLTANNGYWYNALGEVTAWGEEDATYFIEYRGDSEESDPEDLSCFYVGNFPEVDPFETACNIGFMKEDNVVLFNVEVKCEALEYGEINIIKTVDLYFTNKPSESDYVTAPLPFNADEVKEALGCEALTAAMLISLDSEGDIVATNANGIGYWYGYDGSVTPWGPNAAWWIEVNNASDATEFLVGNFPECEEAEGTCNIGFLYDGSAVLFNVAVSIYPDAEYDGVESLVSDDKGEKVIYNLQGVKVNAKDLNTLKGLYIINGKKVLVK